MKIRVATYNIHKGVTSIRSKPRVLALKKAIGMFGADVVFLQRRYVALVLVDSGEKKIRQVALNAKNVVLIGSWRRRWGLREQSGGG